MQAKCVNGILNMHTRHYYAFIWGTTWKNHTKKQHSIFSYAPYIAISWLRMQTGVLNS